jgi:hypothetical protein
MVLCIALCVCRCAQKIIIMTNEIAGFGVLSLFFLLTLSELTVKQFKMCTQQVWCSLQGVLAKASYELFCAEKSHVANGKAQACTQDALLFFLLTLERWGEGGCSHYVPFKFQWVPIMFSKCSSSSQFVTQHVLCSTHFHPICFGNWCPPFSPI